MFTRIIHKPASVATLLMVLVLIFSLAQPAAQVIIYGTRCQRTCW
jgi:hypothetical protein